MAIMENCIVGTLTAQNGPVQIDFTSTGPKVVKSVRIVTTSATNPTATLLQIPGSPATTILNIILGTTNNSSLPISADYQFIFTGQYLQWARTDTSQPMSFSYVITYVDYCDSVNTLANSQFLSQGLTQSSAITGSQFALPVPTSTQPFVYKSLIFSAYNATNTSSTSVCTLTINGNQTAVFTDTLVNPGTNATPTYASMTLLIPASVPWYFTSTNTGSLTATLGTGAVTLSAYLSYWKTNPQGF